MKKIAIFSVMAILVAAAFIVPSGYGTLEAMSKNYRATIEKGAYFVHEHPYIILRSRVDLDNYISETMASMTMDTAEVPQNYWKNVEKQVRGQYSRFDEAFFANNTLVVALIDQGSGSVRYAVQDVRLHGGELTVDVFRDSPMIQTMDFVSWILFLELEKPSFNKSTILNIKDLHR